MESTSVPLFHSQEVLEYLKLKKLVFMYGIYQSSIGNEVLQEYLYWLYQAPKYTTYRVNSKIFSAIDAISQLQNILEDAACKDSISLPDIFIHPSLPDLLVLGPVKYLAQHSINSEKNVIVDSACGAAVLRGAHVYAPGVLGMPAGVKKGDEINIVADLQAGCRKGLKKDYKGKIVFIGKGIALMTRGDLFMQNKTVTGVAIEVKSTTSGCAILPANNPSANSLSSLLLLQNLPSVVCGWVLNPQPGQIVLDACAAPGNKTTHLSSLMYNQGIIVALDKTSSKVNSLKQNCEKMGATNVRAFTFDSTKAVIDSNDLEVSKNPLTDPPPYAPNTFDKVLLDAPCSALGQRPQLANWTSVSQLKSYPVLQRNLFKSAVSLVKEGGQLLYCTCTITLEENEEMVAWALQSFPNLSLEEVTPRIGGCGGKGWPVKGLTPELQAKVLRFGPPVKEITDGCTPCDMDTIGFFLALFQKGT